MVMKNLIIVDVNTDRTEQPIIIGKPTGVEPPKTHEEAKKMIIDDMACLCEALCTLIRAAEHNGYAPSSESLGSCIDHLEQGVDSSYWSVKPTDAEGLV